MIAIVKCVQNSKTPEPIVAKFDVGDYVGDKMQNNRPPGGVLVYA